MIDQPQLPRRGLARLPPASAFSPGTASRPSRGRALPVTQTAGEWRRQLGARALSHPARGRHRAGLHQPAQQGEAHAASSPAPAATSRLFASATKFDSGTGWPSFWSRCPRRSSTKSDRTLGWSRTEVCAALRRPPRPRLRRRPAADRPALLHERPGAALPAGRRLADKPAPRRSSAKAQAASRTARRARFPLPPSRRSAAFGQVPLKRVIGLRRIGGERRGQCLRPAQAPLDHGQPARLGPIMRRKRDPQQGNRLFAPGSPNGQARSPDARSSASPSTSPSSGGPRIMRGGPRARAPRGRPARVQRRDHFWRELPLRLPARPAWPPSR